MSPPRSRLRTTAARRDGGAHRRGWRRSGAHDRAGLRRRRDLGQDVPAGAPRAADFRRAGSQQRHGREGEDVLLGGPGPAPAPGCFATHRRRAGGSACSCSTAGRDSQTAGRRASRRTGRWNARAPEASHRNGRSAPDGLRSEPSRGVRGFAQEPSGAVRGFGQKGLPGPDAFRRKPRHKPRQKPRQIRRPTRVRGRNPRTPEPFTPLAP